MYGRTIYSFSFRPCSFDHHGNHSRHRPGNSTTHPLTTAVCPITFFLPHGFLITSIYLFVLYHERCCTPITLKHSNGTKMSRIKQVFTGVTTSHCSRFCSDRRENRMQCCLRQQTRWPRVLCRGGVSQLKTVGSIRCV